MKTSGVMYGSMMRAGSSTSNMQSPQKQFSDVINQMQGINLQKQGAMKSTILNGKVEAPQSIRDTSISSKNQMCTMKNNTNSTNKKQFEVKKNEVADVYTKELVSNLKEELGLTDEEMEEILAALGMVWQDLFQLENLTVFVLESFGAQGITDALVNEQLSSALFAATEILNDVVANIEQELLQGFDQQDTGEEFEDSLVNAVKETGENSATGKKEIKVEVHKEEDHRDGREDEFVGQENHPMVDHIADKISVSGLQEDSSSMYKVKQIVTQLVDQIKVNISQTKTSMEMVLNPEALGKVQVVVQKTAGVLTAHLRCENEMTKQALETSIQVLKESFESQGLKVEKVEVAIGNYSSEYAEQEGHGGEQQNDAPKKRLNIQDYLEEAKGTNEKEEHFSRTYVNGTVEYTA